VRNYRKWGVWREKMLENRPNGGFWPLNADVYRPIFGQILSFKAIIVKFVHK
jgi:hypothetical protein